MAFRRQQRGQAKQGKKRKQRDPAKQPRVRTAIARNILKVPLLRRFYLKRLLAYIDKTPRQDLPPELRELQVALSRVPRPKRLATLESVLRQGPEVVQQSRSLRRAAAKQQKRTRR